MSGKPSASRVWTFSRRTIQFSTDWSLGMRVGSVFSRSQPRSNLHSGCPKEHTVTILRRLCLKGAPRNQCSQCFLTGTEWCSVNSLQEEKPSSQKPTSRPSKCSKNTCEKRDLNSGRRPHPMDHAHSSCTTIMPVVTQLHQPSSSSGRVTSKCLNILQTHLTLPPATTFYSPDSRTHSEASNTKMFQQCKQLCRELSNPFQKLTLLQQLTTCLSAG